MYKKTAVFIAFFLIQSILLPLQRARTQSIEHTPEKRSDIHENGLKSTPVSYQDVFGRFGDNAERLYGRYGAFALAFLKEYGIDGLFLLEKFGGEMVRLYPLLDYQDIFHLYRHTGNDMQCLSIFTPQVLAEFYKTFGDGGVKFAARDPENFILINKDTTVGNELIRLANEKGDIVFPLARKHGIAFARIYDKDVLDIVVKFQEDGLLAVKEYGEKAKILFRHFLDDDTFYHVIKTYGHKQTIPVLYLFYDNRDFDSQVYNYVRQTNAYEWISSWWYGTSASGANAQNDLTVRRENARRAVHLIFELGNDFLDRFEILDINNVKEEAVTTITNKLRNFFVSDIEKVSRKRIRQEEITFQDKLFAGLDALGFVPIGSGISKGAKLAAKGARLARTTKGFRGILHLTDDLVAAYGDDVVPFVAKYGDEGISALKSTDGKVLKLSQRYGDDAVRHVSQYGADAESTIEKYGEAALSLARQHGDDVIKYVSQYGDDGLKIIQKHGKDIVLLSSLYGDDAIRLVALYGDDVVPYIAKYGSNGVKVIEKYGQDVTLLAKRYGDDVIKYAGLYGDDGIRLAGKGKAGMLVMRYLSPKALAKCIKFVKYGLIATLGFAIATHPLAFLSGLVKALAWLCGTSPVVIAILLGLVLAFFMVRFLRRFKVLFKPF